MSDQEIERIRRELADHDAREQAKQRPRPEWRGALDDLFVANYANDAFWYGDGTASGLEGIMHGVVTDDNMAMTRAFFASKCRICGRPMHARWRTCQYCGAEILDTPAVISGTVAYGEIESNEEKS